ncbi:MAG: hypothetical protein EP346_01775 [Bacteroidetes bacterium]|uniref:Uncharacterized protein n=1 Tax=Phaeocystidibacter marisrubri TaxID=1577780 RepID=A0A6L3ZJS5_9FLAO|nr:hypothetical protein [Phaeocystidibacter marisrubri]KAB2817889.1 hypothetical protein F8C82_05655 [Phaeocystidibacter marisrubri]TNE31162.1 MAG: hypothetical protein EP346_01775 [Bacteroidota bacterium]GGH73023.1 hypothetical protein GCM10011318_17610 [Phaeocystidibacter marisrubri]
MIELDKQPEVRIRAFRAVDDPESSQKFIDGHRKVLEVHGVKKVTSANHAWAYNPAVFVIIVESLDGKKVYGGARVHAAGGTQQLPIEEATGFMDNKIYDLVKKLSIDGTGELCGLWNSIEVAGLGVGSFFATRAGAVITEQLGIKSLFALCAPYTVRWAERVGCKILTEVGNQGTFYYPKLDLLATAVLLEDTSTLEHARGSEQRKIQELRQNLQQVTTEVSPGRRIEVEVEYDLLLPNIKPNEFKDPFSQISAS